MESQYSEYTDNLDALDNLMKDHAIYEEEEGIMKGGKPFQRLSKAAYVPEKTIIALDGGKQLISCSTCLWYRLAEKKIRNTFGPVQHKMSSIIS